jgi:hypothetical protein
MLVLHAAAAARRSYRVINNYRMDSNEGVEDHRLRQMPVLCRMREKHRVVILDELKLAKLFIYFENRVGHANGLL